jgi:hypothetical protein
MYLISLMKNVICIFNLPPLPSEMREVKNPFIKIKFINTFESVKIICWFEKLRNKLWPTLTFLKISRSTVKSIHTPL